MPTNPPTALPEDIHDIKPPWVIPDDFAWLWWLVGGLALLAVLLFLWYRFFRTPRQVEMPPPVPAHVRARQKLADALALIKQPKPFCVLVSDTLRTYLEERFTFHAPERTTEEFLRELQESSLLVAGQKESLARFLESCDLVKFAKYEPAPAELQELHHAALRLVEETEPRPAPPTAKAKATPTS